MKKHTSPLLFLFLINPFLSFIYSLFIFIKKGNKISIFFSLSLSLILIYFPIMYDTSNHFYYILNNKENLNIDFQENIFFNSYINAPIILGKYFKIDFYYFYYFYIFISIFLWSKLVSLSNNKCNIKNKEIYAVLLLLFSFNYRDLMDLTRSFLSYSIVFFYIICFRKKNLLNNVLFMYLSLAIHFSTIFIWLLFFISKIKVFRVKSYTVGFISCLIVGSIFPFLMLAIKNIVLLIPGELGAKTYFYIYGSDFAIRDFSIGPFLKKSFNYIIIIIFSIHSLRLLSLNKNDTILKLTIIISSLSLLFIQYVTLFERLNLALNFLFVYIFLAYKIKYKINRQLLISLICLKTLILYTFVYFPIFQGNHDIVIPNSRFLIDTELKPFYYPTFLLFDIDNGYSDYNLEQQSVWGKYH
ncbi:TPA: hypothetical protein ACKRFJ_001477 [Proteus mirabilis]|nr:hypothetical protein [Proteus mirabilis]HEJ9661357.1 hypothetical protein [Proteus mirabilis]